MVKLSEPSLPVVAVRPVETKLFLLRDQTNKVTVSPLTPLRSALSTPLMVSVWCLACATTLLFRCRNVASGGVAALAAPAVSSAPLAARTPAAVAAAARTVRDVRMQSPLVKAAAAPSSCRCLPPQTDGIPVFVTHLPVRAATAGRPCPLMSRRLSQGARVPMTPQAPGVPSGKPGHDSVA